MPYIKQSRRKGAQTLPTDAGELNYAITMLIHNFWQNRNATGYQNLNDIIGALEGAKLEFYRRMVVPYEDQKIRDNGDVP